MVENKSYKNGLAYSKTPYFYEELQIEDDDSSLVENGEQQELDIDDNE
jgi:hypothetical protein